VIVAVVADDEATVSISNVWLELPAAIVTLAGTVAAALLLVNDTSAPPVGAADVNVTVPVTISPPETDVGDNETDCSAAVVVVVGAVDEDPPQPAAASAAHAASTKWSAACRRTMRMSVRIVRPLVQARGHGRALTLSLRFHDFAALPSQTMTREDEPRVLSCDFRKQRLSLWIFAIDTLPADEDRRPLLATRVFGGRRSLRLPVTTAPPRNALCRIVAH